MNRLFPCIQSVALLFVSLFVFWFFFSVLAISWPPGPDFWYRYPGHWFTLALFLPAAIVAGRFWYWLPIFFAFGALAVFPLICFVVEFGSRYRDFSTRAQLAVAIPAIIACCVAGSLAAWAGSFASRRLRRRSAVPNHALQRTEAGGTSFLHP